MLVLSLAVVNVPLRLLKVVSERVNYVVATNLVAHLLRIVLHLL